MRVWAVCGECCYSLNIIYGGWASLLGHCFPTVTSALTDAIELLCPFLIVTAIKSGSHLSSTITVAWETWFYSLNPLHWWIHEPNTVCIPWLLPGPNASYIWGLIWDLKVLNSAKNKSMFAPEMYPPWEATMLLSLILPSFTCHIWKVKVLACLLPELAKAAHSLILCSSRHKCIILSLSLSYQRTRCHSQTNHATIY